jgi:aryl sulfotransferase
MIHMWWQLDLGYVGGGPLGASGYVSRDVDEFAEEEVSREYPTRDKLYVGPVTNSTIWADFELRDDDVIVSTPPKSGTTWMQSIVAMLIFGRPGMDVRIGDTSPWLDCGFRDREAIVERLSAQDHRRCIKSHTPLDGISYDRSNTYLAVYRHPVDVYFSMRSHTRNTRPENLSPKAERRFTQDVSEGFRLFVGDGSQQDNDQVLSLDSVAYHYQSFKEWAHLQNIHFFHYSDLKRDLEGQIARLASILGIPHSPDIMRSIVEGSGFDAMQDNAKRHSNPQRAKVFKDPAAFFASGTSEKWKGQLNALELERYQSRISSLLEPSDVDWIENGGLARTDS